MKILAVDYGLRRTGLAVSDDLGITAQGLDTVTGENERDMLEAVMQVIGERRVDTVLLGLPLNMDGTDSDQTAKVRAFGDTLAQTGDVKVIFWDERMTSRQAHRVMHELGHKTGKRKKDIDRISATLMLQEFLQSQP